MVNRRAAFTLIELLIVITIISILAAILIPVFAAAKRSGYGALCISNLRQLHLATLTYANDYDDLLPNAAGPIVKNEITSTPTCFTDAQKATLESMPNLKDLLFNYKLTELQWQCPLDQIDFTHGVLDGRKPTWYAEDGSSYAFDDIDALMSISLSSAQDGSTRLLASDEEPFHGAGDQGDLDSVNRDGRSNCVFFDGHAKSISPALVQSYTAMEGCWFW